MTACYAAAGLCNGDNLHGHVYDGGKELLMKIAALIFGILAGLSGLPLASYAQAIVAFGGGGNSGALYLLPLASFVGAGLALNFTGAAGGILALCTLVWLGIGGQFGHAVNFITISAVLFNGLGALFALIPFFQEKTQSGASSDPQKPRTNSLDSLLYAPRPVAGPAPTYDRAKWNALVKYDAEVRGCVDTVKQFGDKWIDVLAADYLALNDKSYLPAIVRKVVDNAREEEQENRRATQRKADEQQALNLERDRVHALKKQQKIQRREALTGVKERLVKIFWGSRGRSLLTKGSILAAGVILIVFGWLLYFNILRTFDEPFSFCKNVGRVAATSVDDRWRGAFQPDEIKRKLKGHDGHFHWTCRNGSVFICLRSTNDCYYERADQYGNRYRWDSWSILNN